MNSTELFKKSKDIISSIIEVIERIDKIYSKRTPYKSQKQEHIRNGLVKIRGIFVTLKGVFHRILFETYELHLISTFLIFYKNLFININNIFTQFSLRTLIDIGIEIPQIFFSDIIKKEEKDRFKLSLMLIDYGIMAWTNPKHKEEFEKLYSEESSLLNENENEIFNKMLMSIKENNKNKCNESIEDALKLNRKLQLKLFFKTKTPDFLSFQKIENLYFHFSHILHGDLYSIGSIFKQKNDSFQHKLRVHSILLFTGCSFIYQFLNQDIPKDLKETINKNISEYKKFEPQIKKFWQNNLK